MAIECGLTVLSFWYFRNGVLLLSEVSRSFWWEICSCPIHSSPVINVIFLWLSSRYFPCFWFSAVWLWCSFLWDYPVGFHWAAGISSKHGKFSAFVSSNIFTAPNSSPFLLGLFKSTNVPFCCFPTGPWGSVHLKPFIFFPCVDNFYWFIFKYRHTSFYCALFNCTSQIPHFLQICGNTVFCKSSGVIFPMAFAHFVSLCHILVVLAIFQTLFIMGICD